jgi:hypothetical protein
MEDDMQTSFRLLNLIYAPPPGLSLLNPIKLPKTEAAERKLDQVLADSFPASDPPPWTLGRASPDEIDQAPSAPSSAHANLMRTDSDVWSHIATHVVIPGGSRTFGQRLTSGVGAVGVALLVPIGILIVGLPIALAVRAVVEMVAWLAPLILR